MVSRTYGPDQVPRGSGWNYISKDFFLQKKEGKKFIDIKDWYA